MNYASLEDHALPADTAAMAMLGQTISYTIGNRIIAIKAHGNLEDGSINAGTSMAVRQEIELMILKSAIPVMPHSSHRIRSARIAGKVFKPVNVRNDDTGHHWLFELQEVSL